MGTHCHGTHESPLRAGDSQAALVGWGRAGTLPTGHPVGRGPRHAAHGPPHWEGTQARCPWATPLGGDTGTLPTGHPCSMGTHSHGTHESPLPDGDMPAGRPSWHGPHQPHQARGDTPARCPPPTLADAARLPHHPQATPMAGDTPLPSPQTTPAAGPCHHGPLQPPPR